MSPFSRDFEHGKLSDQEIATIGVVCVGRSKHWHTPHLRLKYCSGPKNMPGNDLPLYSGGFRKSLQQSSQCFLLRFYQRASFDCSFWDAFPLEHCLLIKLLIVFPLLHVLTWHTPCYTVFTYSLISQAQPLKLQSLKCTSVSFISLLFVNWVYSWDCNYAPFTESTSFD